MSFSHTCSRPYRRQWLWDNRHRWSDYDPFGPENRKREIELAKLFVEHGLYSAGHLRNIDVRKLLQQVITNDKVKCRWPDCRVFQVKRFGVCPRHTKWIEKGYFDQQFNQLKPMPSVKRYSGCKMDGCERKHRRNGFCHRHDGMYKRSSIDLDGNRLKPVIRYKEDFGCIKCGKTGKISKGFCKSHYSQFRKGLIDYDGNKRREHKRIAAYGPLDYCRAKCGGRPRIRGYCEKCHGKIRRGNIDLLGRVVICKSEFCKMPSKSNGYCVKHYRRWVHRQMAAKELQIAI